MSRVLHSQSKAKQGWHMPIMCYVKFTSIALKSRYYALTIDTVLLLLVRSVWGIVGIYCRVVTSTTRREEGHDKRKTQ